MGLLGMTDHEIVGRLRNASGLTFDEMREYRLAAADRIEAYQQKVHVLEEFCRANGLSPVAERPQ